MNFKKKYKEFMKTDDYKQIKSEEEQLQIDLSGIMYFTFETWLNKDKK